MVVIKFKDFHGVLAARAFQRIVSKIGKDGETPVSIVAKESFFSLKLPGLVWHRHKSPLYAQGSKQLLLF